MHSGVGAKSVSAEVQQPWLWCTGQAIRSLDISDAAAIRSRPSARCRRVNEHEAALADSCATEPYMDRCDDDKLPVYVTVSQGGLEASMVFALRSR